MVSTSSSRPRALLGLVLLCAFALVAALPAPASAGEPVEVAALVRGPDGVEIERTLAPDLPRARALVDRLRDRAGTVAADVAAELHVLEEPLRPYQWPLDRLEAERVWEISRGKSAVIAVVDTGVDGTHPDLRDILLPGLDLIDPGGDGSVDGQGHGTGVAGAAAAPENGVGIAGLAPAAAVLPVRVADDQGVASTTDVAEGVVWAADNGADVINLSLGGPQSSSVLEEAVRYAVDQGVVVVAAAGNNRQTGNDPIYPAAYADVLAVAATERDDDVAVFSNSGAYVDLAAPGVEVAVPIPGAQWAYADGTSFSSPYVAAAAALLLARDPELGPLEVANRLLATAEDLGAPGVDQDTGAGLVDPLAALAATPRGDTAAPPPPPPSNTDGGTGPEPGEGSMPPPDLEVTPPVIQVGTAADPVRTAIQVSREAFPMNSTASRAVIGRDDLFADSLAGAALAGPQGPILLTSGGRDAPLRPETEAELVRVLGERGTVYLLGGDLAVSAQVEQRVRALGFSVQRLEGEDRYTTALAVAEQVDPRPGRVLLARGDEWADAITGGAYAASAGVPVLLTPPDQLHPAVDAALAEDRPEITLLGGEVALSGAVEQAAARSGGTSRVFGANRVGTAVAIARTLWGRTTAMPGDAYVGVEGFAPGSWAPALAGAVLSAVDEAPQLLLSQADPGLPQETAAYLDEIGHDASTPGTAVLVGPLLTEQQVDAFAAALGG
jgi:type VII secretion-associated serine protease mycosin